MIPGTTTKLTEARIKLVGTEIHVRTDIVYVEGGPLIEWIHPHFGGGHPGLLVLVALTESIDLRGQPNGNIYGVSTIILHRFTTLVYSKMFQGWFIGSGGTIS